MHLFKKYILLSVVFVTGACVLVIEIVAVRVLSPYYGNTIFSVSSVITVILAALSIGYYAGGRLADRRPSYNLFYGIIVTSGAMVLALQLLALTLLPYMGYRLSLVSGPLVSSMILFFLPGLLLGTLSPFAIKLQKLRVPEEGVGTVAGKVFFWSTCGSIVGSLGAGFILIPRLGVNEIFLGTGVILLAVGMIGMVISGAKKENVLFCMGVSAVLLGSVFSTLAAAKADVMYETDGLYEKITVYDGKYKGRQARFLKQDWSSSSAMFLDSDELAYEYTKYYQLYKIFTPNPKEALVIGAGAYSVPKALFQELPEIRVDVVEIEPALVEVGKRFFRVPDNPRLANYIEDGRRFLHDSHTTYDIIFSDVYVSSIPAHFVTKEFFEIAKSKLAPEGIFLANIVGDLASDPPSFVLAEMKTLRAVFPQSYFFAMKSPVSEELQNFIFVGHKSEKSVNLEGSAFYGKLIDLSRFDFDLYPLLTDNFAPVEYLTAQIWARRIAEER
ncbi:MAG TPA: hypothetical protein DIS53_00405 [Candidatus Wildermuthbacteria bacterium]|nr:MAG: hypothetical protein A3D63_02095 [Candidatus Wildermuthbacteria bacterium RIFCSPHIGHO2_02_FULL_49_17]OHA72314.1 MAG: hypothetical protein A3E08_03450 [Candidatus Wildermuthbacteria bacterium RIFCSPHIGHO2_12_FULL_49_13]OHA75340.1 MAG: hypothetical protein A3B28_03505 [Candidatus Wildermuthbacteria bacterium RIFCSPLOWO2_01_FULL_50_46]OHA78300.1 MAG: hypothetical protein A2564_03250 [Candidatus Wildermuthbacteria bacterium RIFOXYD1_FULL_50_12]HCM36384.1 hypothetical protein [Candidatus Wil